MSTVQKPLDSSEPPSISQAPAIILKMGRKKKRQARRIRRGRGPLQNHVDRAVGYVTERLENDGKEKVIVPIVLIYETKGKRRKKKKKRNWWF